MRGMTPKMDDIEVSEQYDQEDDIYYVTVQTGEPSIVLEHDDQLLIEVGIFTRLPTGLRILNYTKQKTPAHEYRAAFKQFCKAFGLRKLKDERDGRMRMFDKFFEKATA